MHTKLGFKNKGIIAIIIIYNVQFTFAIQVRV